VYAFTENFILPLSHDEVVHGKGSLLGKMPGDRWRQFANLRALFGIQWSHPGKQLLFMGGELAQEREWSHDRELDWHLLDDPDHAGVQALVRDLNHRYRERPALWAHDVDASGFTWLVADDADQNVVAFLRHGDLDDPTSVLMVAANLSPVPRPGYRLGLPVPGRWTKVLDTDASAYGGSDAFAGQPDVEATDAPWQGQPCSAEIDLPPLAVTWWGTGPRPTRSRSVVAGEEERHTAGSGSTGQPADPMPGATAPQAPTQEPEGSAAPPRATPQARTTPTTDPHRPDAPAGDRSMTKTGQVPRDR
jgi:1,4-alpha-glucan branching enzyme